MKWVGLEPSTTVEITIGYLTCLVVFHTWIYNSRNYYRLLNEVMRTIMAYIYNSRNYYRLLNYLKLWRISYIYNSRNYYRLLNPDQIVVPISIYNSRNYYRLLNYGLSRARRTNLQQ